MRHLLPSGMILTTAAVAVVMSLLMLWPAAGGRLDNLLLDPLQIWHAAGQTPSERIAVVDIDEASLQGLAPLVGKWPWPRAVHAQVLEGLQQAGAQAVAFDVLFAEPDLYRPESDAYLREVLSGQDNVFLPVLRLPAKNDAAGQALAGLAAPLGLERTERADADARADLLLPRAVAPARWQGGGINFLASADGTGRRYWVWQDVHGWRLPSLPARLAAHAGAVLPEQPAIHLNWQSRTPLPYPRYSYLDILSRLDAGEPLPKAWFEDKLVIIGATASGLHDLRATPVSAQHPALGLVATATDNLLHAEWLRPVRPGTGLAVALSALVLLGWRLDRGAPLGTTGLLLVLLTAGAVAGSYLLLDYRYRLPVLTPLLALWLLYIAGLVHRYLQERRRRQELIGTFGRFLDPRVVEQLLQAGATPTALSGHSREITVLFSDIRGFTTLSEQRSPEQVVTLLNAYFSRQVEVIFRHHGTLDKFIGDAIMALWGAPADDPEHAPRAVEAALEMVEQLHAFRDELPEAERGFDIGIGIHSGPAVVGFIGSDSRQEYTAIGDTVNLGSRIEGLTKDRARVLISETTRNLCGERFHYTEHGTVQVKGRAEPVRIYEPRRRNHDG